MVKQVICLLFANPAERIGSESRAKTLEALAEACFRFTPKVALRSQEAIFLELRSLDGTGDGPVLPDDHGPREIPLAFRLTTLCQRFGLQPRRMTCAPSAGLALAQARFGCSSPHLLPLEALMDLASPFTQDYELSRHIEKLACTLRKLGLVTLSQFVELPAASLASRFGKEAVVIRQVASMTLGLPDPRDLGAPSRNHRSIWPNYAPPERISEHVDLCNTENLAPCYQLESLLFVLKGILDRVMARLKGRALRASVISIRFEIEKTSTVREKTRSFRIELPMPQGSTSGLLPIIRERLSANLSHRPLEAAVTGILLEIPETAPGNSPQRDFFDEKEQDSESWQALVARLSDKMGKERAFFAQRVERHLPERSWQPLSSARVQVFAKPPKNDQGSVCIRAELLRPTRILKIPETLQKKGELLLHCPTRRQWRIVKWQGPERISGEWWFELNGFERDYYRVLLDCGLRLWVFSTPESIPGEIYYLHGYFD